MAVKLEFAPFAPARTGVLVLFCDDKLNFGPAGRKALGAAEAVFKRAAKADGFKGKRGSALSLPVPHGLAVERLVVVGVGDADKLDPKDAINLGGTALGKIPNSAKSLTISMCRSMCCASGRPGSAKSSR